MLQWSLWQNWPFFIKYCICSFFTWHPNGFKMHQGFWHHNCKFQDAHLLKGGCSVFIFPQSKANMHKLGCLWSYSNSSLLQAVLSEEVSESWIFFLLTYMMMDALSLVTSPCWKSLLSAAWPNMTGVIPHNDDDSKANMTQKERAASVTEEACLAM